MALSPRRDEGNCEEEAGEGPRAPAKGLGVRQIGQPARGPEEGEDVLDAHPHQDAAGRVEDVVRDLVEAVAAAGEEGARGPPETVERHVPEAGVAVRCREPDPGAGAEEGPGEGRLGCGRGRGEVVGEDEVDGKGDERPPQVEGGPGVPQPDEGGEPLAEGGGVEGGEARPRLRVRDVGREDLEEAAPVPAAERPEEGERGRVRCWRRRRGGRRGHSPPAGTQVRRGRRHCARRHSIKER